MITPQRRPRGRAAGRHVGGDGGMVTAELAVGLPALLVVLLAALAAVAATGQQLRCLDAAAGAARLAARDQSGAVSGFVRADGPPGARADTSYAEGRVTVTVSARLRLPLAGVPLPVTVTGRASEPVEPGVAAPGGAVATFRR